MKTISRVISAAVLLALTAGIMAFARTSPAIFFLWYPHFSQWILGVLGDVTAKVGFAVWEVAALGLTFWAVVTLIRSIAKGKLLRWLSGLVWGVSLGAFAFTLFWGAGHFGPAKTEQVVTVREFSTKELLSATEYFAARASETGPAAAADFEVLANQAGDGYAVLSQHYDCFPDTAVTVKPLLTGKVFSYLGSTGIFVPMTAEACVNPDAYPSALPYTMCHEIAHRFGANAEEDANFCAFLACIENPDPAFRYSGWYSAFIYCYNALHAADPDLAQTAWNALSPQVQEDVRATNSHYDTYEGKVQDAAQSVNDAYLEAFGQEGTASYGLVSDALVAWYQRFA